MELVPELCRNWMELDLRQKNTRQNRAFVISHIFRVTRRFTPCLFAENFLP